MLQCDKDSLNIIFSQLDIISQLRLRATCKQLREKLDKLKNKLTDKIIL